MSSREGDAVEKDVVEVRELSSDERLARFDEILDLYEAVGWTNYTSRPEALRAGYAGSLAVWGAFEGDKLVGIMRFVGDDRLCAGFHRCAVASAHGHWDAAHAGRHESVLGRLPDGAPHGRRLRCLRAL